MYLAKFKPDSGLQLIIVANIYGGQEGPFQTSNFSISISELVISKVAFPKLSFPNLQ